jgi:hypothetical protein
MAGRVSNPPFRFCQKSFENFLILHYHHGERRWNAHNKPMVHHERNDDTLRRPLGGELYQRLTDGQGNAVELTYNDLWMLIICRTTLDGDWNRAREAAGMVPDPAHKQALVERLWKLEQALDGLPPIPEDVLKLNLHRAHQWFNQRHVTDGKNR